MSTQQHFYIHDIQWSSESSDQIAVDINKTNSKNIVLDMTWEGFPFADWQKNYQNLISKIKNKKRKIFVIFNNTHKPYQEQLFLSGITDIFFFDYFLYRTYHQVVCLKRFPYQKYWNGSADKFLYLPGRYKSTRIPLFMELVKNNKLSNAVYSLYWKFDEIEPEYQHLINENFLQKFHSCVDTDITHKLASLKFNKEWYEETLFQLVTETFFDDTMFTSEKTYLPIINHSPFLTTTGPAKVLLSHNFKLFEEFHCRKMYHLDIQPKIRSEFIVENINHWLKTIKNHVDDVRTQVNYNFEVLKKVFDQIDKELHQFASKHNLVFDEMISTDSRHVNIDWKIFYQNFKDPDWPESNFLRNFRHLPREIQEECLSNSWFLDWTNSLGRSFTFSA